MTLNPALTFPTRALASIAAAAFLAAAMWLVLPAASQTSWPSSSGKASLPASLQVDGEVAVHSTDGVVTSLTVPLSVLGDESIILTEGGRLHASTFMSETAAAAVPSRYSVAWLDGNGDELLDPGEHAVLTVELPYPSPVREGNPLELIIRPVEGLPFVIEDVLP
jgi:hypothetical protein